MNKLVIIAKREYLQVVKKPSFWITTLLFPLLFIVLSIVSALSSQSAEARLEQLAKEAKGIYIVDQGGILNKDLIQPPFEFAPNTEVATQAVREGKYDAAIIYPADFATSLKIEIKVNSKGIFSDGAYNEGAVNLVKQSILSTVAKPELIAVFNSQYNVTTQSFKNGEEIKTGFEAFIVPGIAVIIYFILVTFATSLLLQSVSEEKENRMIETILSIVTPRQLIWGKIIGQLSIVLTQMALLLVFAVVGLLIWSRSNTLDLTAVSITPAQIIWALFFTICGFLLNANIMVGVGAAMPTFREAGNLSSVFIIAAMIPVYLVANIIAEPSGTVATFLSYFPFTAPMILLFRNSLGELSSLEMIVGPVVCLVYVAVSFVLAFKLFEFGALEYNNKISFRSFLGSLRKR